MKNHQLFIVSPHIDDAAYGLTVHISHWINRHIAVNIINCFTDTSWTICFISKDKEEICRLRKMEDIEFNKLFDSRLQILNLDLLDAPLRNGFIFQSKSFENIEWEMVNRLKASIELHVPGGATLLCPLAIGNHIDHAICLEAISQLYQQYTVIFFEDLPYANRISEQEIYEHVQLLEEKLQVKLSPRLLPFDNCSIRKEDAIKIYRTQLNDAICAEIIAHLNRVKGERLWAERSAF